MRDSPPRIWRLRDKVYSLKYSHCRSCGAKLHPPRASCPRCGSREQEVLVSKGVGVLLEHTVLYQAPSRYQDQAPMIFGLIRLDEGFTVYGQVVGIRPEDLRRGLRVEAVLRRLRQDGSSGLITYGIKFRPAVGGVRGGEGQG